MGPAGFARAVAGDQTALKHYGLFGNLGLGFIQKEKIQSLAGWNSFSISLFPPKANETNDNRVRRDKETTKNKEIVIAEKRWA
jgi:hypothetical protein